MKAKGDSGERLAGFFFPVTAAQVFNLNDAPQGEISNGVYIPHVFALRFVGEYTMQKVWLSSCALQPLQPLRFFNAEGALVRVCAAA